ncbi:MAG TPA: hypothetical protein VGO62_08480 [Myxococcota bacterium]|jgi:hypothetical protein
MKPTTSTLSVDDFRMMLEMMCQLTERELTITRARMDALRTEQAPPG